MNEDKLYIITELDKLSKAMDYIKSNIVNVNHICSFDTESDGANSITNEIIGFSISLFDDEGFYFPFKTMTDERSICTESPNAIPKEGQNVNSELMQCVSDEFKSRALELLNLLKDYRLLMHNATFDVVIVRNNFDIDYVNSIHCDTMLLKHTIDCDKPHGLKDCGVKYFGEDSKDEQEELGGSVIRNGGKWTARDKWVWFGDIYYVGKYAIKDTILTLKLYNHLDPELDKLDLRKFFYEDEVIPLLKYGTIPMKSSGFKIDVNHFKRAKLRIQAEVEEIDRQLRSEVSDVTGPMEQIHLDKEFPPTPNRSFAQYLILEAGLPLPINAKTGKFSTAKRIIDAWSINQLKKANEDQIKVIWYITGEVDKVPDYLIKKTQYSLWEDKKDRPLVNFGSAKQFEYIVNKKWGIKSTEKTKSGDPSFTAKVIESITLARMQEIDNLTEIQAAERFSEYMECEELPKEADWFIKYLRKKKLEKLISSFIDGILDKQINGKIHTDLLAHGTTSGRYSSKNPNCLSLDTEILTNKGWLTHSEWREDAKVAAVKEGKVNWETPDKLYISPINSPSITLVSLKNIHVDIRATDNHRMLVEDRKTKELKEVTFNQIYNNNYRDYNIIHGATLDAKGIALKDDEIRLLVAIQADATIYNKGFIRFSFSKTRKAERLQGILDRLNIEYEYVSKDNLRYKSKIRYEFYLRDSNYYLTSLPEYLNDKSFNWGLLEMSTHQRGLFLQELDYWDGLSTRPRTNYNSCTEINVDVVQALCSLNNERAHKRIYDYNLNRGEGSRSYQLDMTQRNYSGLANIVKTKEESTERVWCVEVPSGMFIARRGGDTFVIYNCQQLPSHSALGMVIKRGFVAN